MALTNFIPNIPATTIFPGTANQMSLPSLSGLFGMGMGMDSTAGTDADARGFLDGIKMWTSPSSAFGEINHIALGTETAPIAYTAGVVLPPILAIGLMLTLISGRRR